MDDNKEKKEKNNREDEINKAQKEMEELMKSIRDEMGNQNVKVVKIQLPQPTFKNFILGLIITLLINSLLIVGTSGYIEIFEYNNILDLLYFSVYFTLVERILNFIFIKLFMPLIIRTMGLASLIPYVISIALVLMFPIFVVVENLFSSLMIIIFVCVCKSKIHSFIQNKLWLNKIRRKK